MANFHAVNFDEFCAVLHDVADFASCVVLLVEYDCSATVAYTMYVIAVNHICGFTIVYGESAQFAWQVERRKALSAHEVCFTEVFDFYKVFICCC